MRGCLPQGGRRGSSGLWALDGGGEDAGVSPARSVVLIRSGAKVERVLRSYSHGTVDLRENARICQGVAGCSFGHTRFLLSMATAPAPAPSAKAKGRAELELARSGDAPALVDPIAGVDVNTRTDLERALLPNAEQRAPPATGEERHPPEPSRDRLSALGGPLLHWPLYTANEFGLGYACSPRAATRGGELDCLLGVCCPDVLLARTLSRGGVRDNRSAAACCGLCMGMTCIAEMASILLSPDDAGAGVMTEVLSMPAGPACACACLFWIACTAVAAQELSELNVKMGGTPQLGAYTANFMVCPRLAALQASRAVTVYVKARALARTTARGAPTSALGMRR